MTGEGKIMRVVRCRNDQLPGTLGRLLIRVSEAGGDVGSIRLIQETHLSTIRDLTVYADDMEQLERVLAAMAANPGGARRSARAARELIVAPP